MSLPGSRQPSAAAQTPAIADCIIGTFHFPGVFAFFETAAIQSRAIMQFDDPFVGQFDDVTAQRTCAALQAQFHEGQRHTITGKVLNRDVNGVNRPVLFLFDRPKGAPPCPNI